MDWVWMVGIVFAMTLVSQGSRMIDAGEEGHHHRTFENEHVRLFAVEVDPGRKTLAHKHSHPFVYVVIGDSEIDNHIEGTGTVHMKLTNGQVIFVEPLVHVAENTGTTPFRNVTVELKHAMSGSFASPLNGVRGSGYSIRPIAEREGVRVYELTILPGGELDEHSHSVPHVVVPVSDVELENLPASGEAKRIVQPMGKAVWVPAGVRHTLRNVGKQEAKMIVVEVAP